LAQSAESTIRPRSTGDTLINEVVGDAAAKQRLIDQDDDLAKEKFTLAEISKDPGLVEGKLAHSRIYRTVTSRMPRRSFWCRTISTLTNQHRCTIRLRSSWRRPITPPS
jgi:hypothetical protein